MRAFLGVLLFAGVLFGQKPLPSPVQVTSTGGGGSGVTNVATTGPITGGPITTTGTIACATCATAASGGSLTTAGAFAATLTVTAATNVTLPTSGTLATTAQINTYTATAPITLTANAFGIGITANLQVTSTNLDTIQGIQTTSTPQFAGLGIGVAASSGVIKVPSATAGAPSIAINDSGNYTKEGLYLASANQLGLACNGSACLVVGFGSWTFGSWNAGSGLTFAASGGGSGNLNRAGDPFFFKCGPNTGSAAGCYHDFQATIPGTSGTAAGTLASKMQIGNQTNTGTTVNFKDALATTGATRVNIDLGAADSASTVVFTSAGEMQSPGHVFTAAAPTVAAAQVGLGSTTAASSSCGSIAGAAGCLVINVAGTTRNVPYF